MVPTPANFVGPIKSTRDGINPFNLRLRPAPLCEPCSVLLRYALLLLLTFPLHGTDSERCPVKSLASAALCN
jgi:hypothetical protein